MGRPKKQGKHSTRVLSGRGRPAPAWVRELARLGFGTRGPCTACDEWATLLNGFCAACTRTSPCIDTRSQAQAESANTP
jgi:hypothetical protein